MLPCLSCKKIDAPAPGGTQRHRRCTVLLKQKRSGRDLLQTSGRANNTIATDVGTEEVLTAGMQQWPDVSRSYAHTVGPRYPLNRKYLLSHVLSTVKVSVHAWTSFSTSTDQSHIWMSPLLLLSLAIRPWSQQPATDQDSWPRELKRANSTDTHTSTSFFSSSRPQVDLGHTPENSSATSCGTLTTLTCHQGHLESYPKCAPQSHLQTTTHSRRYVISGDLCHSLLSSAHRAATCKYRPNGNAHSVFQSQAYRSRAMWPCCGYTSSDDDEHNTDNNFLLLFADVDITPNLLAGLSEIEVLRMALGCRFALDIFTISQQLSPTPDLEPPPLDSELEPLL